MAVEQARQRRNIASICSPGPALVLQRWPSARGLCSHQQPALPFMVISSIRPHSFPYPNTPPGEVQIKVYKSSSYISSFTQVSWEDRLLVHAYACCSLNIFATLRITTPSKGSTLLPDSSVKMENVKGRRIAGTSIWAHMCNILQSLQKLPRKWIPEHRDSTEEIANCAKTSCHARVLIQREVRLKLSGRHALDYFDLKKKTCMQISACTEEFMWNQPLSKTNTLSVFHMKICPAQVEFFIHPTGQCFQPARGWLINKYCSPTGFIGHKDLNSILS